MIVCAPVSVGPPVVAILAQEVHHSDGGESSLRDWILLPPNLTRPVGWVLARTLLVGANGIVFYALGAVPMK